MNNNNNNDIILSIFIGIILVFLINSMFNTPKIIAIYN
jgi:hypothetical protein